MSAENAQNIGSASVRWEDLYVDDGYIRNAYIDEYVYHNGENTNYIKFSTDEIELDSGNSTLKLTSAGKTEIHGPNLGGTSGDNAFHATIRGARHHLDFVEHRTANGTNWNNTTYKLNMRVDSTNHQSIDFVSDSGFSFVK